MNTPFSPVGLHLKSRGSLFSLFLLCFILLSVANCDHGSGTRPSEEGPESPSPSSGEGQDEDNDGYLAASSGGNDCDDTNAAIHPDQTETCDGADNDCNGENDEGVLTTFYTDADGDGHGDPETTVSACSAPAGTVASADDCNDSDAAVYTGASESCDGKDNDCDGLFDATGTDTGWQRSVCGAVVTGGSADDPNGDDQPSVLYNGVLNKYQMWFRMVTSTTASIGYAESTDGVHWTKHATPVLKADTASSWENIRLGFPSVLYKDNLYRMWYQGQNSAGIIRIGYATSSDGIAWTRFSGNPVLSEGTGNAWDFKLVQAPSVLYDETLGNYRMWYTGSNGSLLRTGHAESPNGVTWTKGASYVLDVGASDAWDSKRAVFARVHVYYSPACGCSRYHLWYSGDELSPNDLSYKIGYAWSDDGKSWTKHASNPVFSFDASSSANFDAFMVYAADVIPLDEGYAMFYSGGTGTSASGPYAIGMAVNLTPEP